jgi:glycine oxidase
VLAPFIEAPAEGTLHDLTVQSLAMYDEFIASVSHDAQTPLEFRRCGTLEVAADAASAARLAALGEWARSIGVDAQWLEAREVSCLEPALGATEGGLLVPSHGYVRVMQLTGALVEAARRHGATVRTGRRVDSITHVGESVTATAGSETYRAGTLILAAGSWSGLLAPETAVKPIRGQLLQLRWHGPPVTRVLWSESCYIVPWLDGTLLVGATVEDAGFDERVTVTGVRALMAAASAVLPAVGEATFVEARAGLRPATPSGLPLIQRSVEHPGVIHATGHYRNGILLAPLTARIVADLVL